MRVVRDELTYEGDELDIGFEMETWDLLATKDDGLAELELNTPGNEGSIITVQPNTAFYFASELDGAKKQTRFEMLKGSLGLKVAKVFDDGEVFVSTESVVAGVRGTEFTVTAGADGSLLVTCTEGEVSCRDTEGTEYTAAPGQAVENLEEGVFRETALAGKSVAEFRREWIAARLTRFRAEAPRLLRRLTPLYRQLHADFHTAFAELFKHRRVFRKWARYYRSGTSPAPGEAVQDRDLLAPGIRQMSAVFSGYERVHFRMLEIRRLFLLYRLRDFNLQGRETAARFLRQLAREEREVRRKLAVTRMYYKIFRYINWMAERE